jgi:hypothetical protein
VVLGIGASLFANDKDNSISLRVISNQDNSIHSLVYYSDSKKPVSIRIYDEDRNLIHKDLVESNAFFKSYSFSNLKSGKYYVKVFNGDSFVAKSFSVNTILDKALDVDLDLVSDSRYKVIVKGVDNPINLSITNDEGDVVYSDIINANKDFSRVYDLSNIKSEKFTFTVRKKDKILRKSI